MDYIYELYSAFVEYTFELYSVFVLCILSVVICIVSGCLSGKHRKAQKNL